MRIIGYAADRMLAAFVPKAKAGACCAEAGCYYSTFGCSPGWAQKCCWDCNCHTLTCYGCP